MEQQRKEKQRQSDPSAADQRRGGYNTEKKLNHRKSRHQHTPHIQSQSNWEFTGTADWFVSRLERTMADNVNEGSDYTPGKDELNWGYEEGRLASV